MHNIFVITLLDIPLLSSSDAPLQERLQNFKTLKGPISAKKCDSEYATAYL